MNFISSDKLQRIRFSHIAFIASVVALLAYYGALLALALNGVRVNTGIAAALITASRFPGLFGVSYLLQGLAFMLWALVGIAYGRVFYNTAPGLALSAAIVGSAGFLWRALSDFAKAGSMEYLGRLYAFGDDNARIFAEYMANWTQLWTFGAVWELLSNALALGLLTLLAGLLLVAAKRTTLGWLLAVLGALSFVSLVATVLYYLTGATNGLPVIAAPGVAAAVVGPLVMVWLAWLAWRQDVADNLQTDEAGADEA